MVGVVGRIVSGNLTLSRGLEEKLLRPDQYDPLSFGPSEGLIAASKAKRLNLVANLPDSLAGGLGQLMQAMSPGSGPASTVHQFLARMFASSDVQAAIDGGWLTVEPKEPSKSRRERVDRRALAALLADTRRTGTLSLDALAAYAVDNPPPTQSPGALLHIMLMAPGAVGGMQGAMSDWNLLRFWGTLGQAQRETLFRGGTIAFGQLTPVQRTSLERVLFGPNANLRVTQGTGNRTPRGGLMGMVENMLPRPARDFREEPTEIMPTGLPAMGTISASNRVETVAYPAGTSAGIMGRMALGPTELAMFQWVREQGNLPMGGVMPNIENVRIGERRNTTLTFTVAPGVTATRNLTDDRVDANAAPVSMNSLPPAFRAAVEQELSRLRQEGNRITVFPGARPNPNP
ncbi:MAG: hypothetical protein SNJ74_05355 [Fimbriimonadaceae bacterium]